MRTRRGAAAAALALALAACAPTLDWREVRPAGSGVAMLFPCRPDRLERPVRIAGADLRMQMHSCAAAGATFSLAFVDAPGPEQVASLLAELRARARANIAGTGAEPQPFRPPGATPNEQGGRLRLDGRLPDGRHVVEDAAFFVHGLRVYQATALGGALAPDALDTFFGAIKVKP